MRKNNFTKLRNDLITWFHTLENQGKGGIPECNLNPSLPSKQIADDRVLRNCRSIGKACSFLRGTSTQLPSTISRRCQLGKFTYVRKVIFPCIKFKLRLETAEKGEFPTNDISWSSSDTPTASNVARMSHFFFFHICFSQYLPSVKVREESYCCCCLVRIYGTSNR